MIEHNITIKCTSDEECNYGCKGFDITKNGAVCNIFRGSSLRTNPVLMNGHYEDHTFRCEACKELFDNNTLVAPSPL